MSLTSTTASFALLVGLLLCILLATVPIEAQAAIEAPPTVDLRPKLANWNLPPRRQGSRGTCSVFAITGALEFAMATKEKHGTRLSVEFLNWAAHHAVGRRQDGGFFSDLWSGFQRYGVCPETALPYERAFNPDLQPEATVLDQAKANRDLGLKLHWIKEWNVRTGLSDAQIEEIRQTLRKGWPVCGGLRWPKREEWKEGVLQMRAPEDVFDGHSVLLVGYREDAQMPGGGAFLIRNSGGSGQDGYLPYAYVHAYMNDAAWIEG